MSLQLSSSDDSHVEESDSVLVVELLLGLDADTRLFHSSLNLY
jgi:hypothetical protein